MELERFVAALVRRWWIIGIAGALGALFGLLAENSRSDLFVATATIEIAPDLDVFGSESVLNRIVLNEMGLIGSSELRRSVVEELDADDELDVDRDFALQQVTDTDLVNVSVSTPDEALSVEAANLWAQTYVDLIRDRERSDLEQRISTAVDELQAARDERLSLDTRLRSSVVVRDTGLVSTYLEAVLRRPELWDEILKLDQEIDLLIAERSVAQIELSTILDSSVVANAVGPIEPTRTGNGLGLVQGVLIAISIAAAGVGLTARDRVSLRAADQFSSSVWPTSVSLKRSGFALPRRRRKVLHDISSVGTQILNRLPDTRLQVVSFAGVNRDRTQHLKSVLADHFRERGYSVSLMGDDKDAGESPTVEGILELLSAQDSVIFADHEELQSQRFSGRIVTVVAIDEHRDREELAAMAISESLEVSDSVLTVVAK